MRRLLDHSGALTDAQVRINGVDETHWNSILTQIRNDAYDEERANPSLKLAPELSPSELHGISVHRRGCGPAGLGNAMLRRVGLFTGADSVEAWPMLPACEIHVEMDGGPSVRDVANALAYPIVGIVHGETAVRRLDDSAAEIVDRTGVAIHGGEAPGTPAFVIRRSPTSHAGRLLGGASVNLTDLPAVSLPVGVQLVDG
ncbi:hypothetical protein [Amycolatopsis sp. WGS_07]|uniref:hypothetical protein n=1 Tax=Amycolatopsis sp. WGS_07 TaxID=3076764 RepID=UPI003872C612